MAMASKVTTLKSLATAVRIASRPGGPSLVDRAQAVVVAGQVLAGLGNLVFVNAGAANNLPLMDTAFSYLGSPTPSREIGWGNTITLFRNVTLFAQLDSTKSISSTTPKPAMRRITGSHRRQAPFGLKKAL